MGRFGKIAAFFMVIWMLAVALGFGAALFTHAAGADESDAWYTYVTGAIIDPDEVNPMFTHMTGNRHPRETSGARSTREVFYLGSNLYPWKNIFLSNGTVTAPAVAFGKDTGVNTGIYRIGEGNIGIACDGAKIVDISTREVFISLQDATEGAGVGINRTGNILISIGMKVTQEGGTLGNAAIIGKTYGTGVENIGVDGEAFGAGTNNYGIWGAAENGTASNIGVYGAAVGTGALAGHFVGDVHITEDLSIEGDAFIGDAFISGDITSHSKVRAHLSADEVISTVDLTLLLLSAESFDTKSEFNTSTCRFTAIAEGYYQINAQVRFENVASGSQCYMLAKKNGTTWLFENYVGTATTLPSVLSTSDVVFFNANDYLEIWVASNDGSYLITGDDLYTFLSIHKI